MYLLPNINVTYILHYSIYILHYFQKDTNEPDTSQPRQHLVGERHRKKDDPEVPNRLT